MLEALDTSIYIPLLGLISVAPCPFWLVRSSHENDFQMFALDNLFSR